MPMCLPAEAPPTVGCDTFLRSGPALTNDNGVGASEFLLSGLRRVLSAQEDRKDSGWKPRKGALIDALSRVRVACAVSVSCRGGPGEREGRTEISTATKDRRGCATIMTLAAVGSGGVVGGFLTMPEGDCA